MHTISPVGHRATASRACFELREGHRRSVVPASTRGCSVMPRSRDHAPPRTAICRDLLSAAQSFPLQRQPRSAPYRRPALPRASWPYHRAPHREPVHARTPSPVSMRSTAAAERAAPARCSPAARPAPPTRHHPSAVAAYIRYGPVTLCGVVRTRRRRVAHPQTAVAHRQPAGVACAQEALAVEMRSARRRRVSTR